MSLRPEQKPVLFTARPGPNFLWHMLAVARISYDSNYADRHAGSVARAGLDVLCSHADLLRFGSGDTSALTGFFTFLPAWLRLESKGDFARYFTAADRCLREGRLGAIVEDFPDADWLDPWFHHFTVDPGGEPDEDLRGACAALAAVYLENVDTYLETIWPGAERAMRPRISELSAQFERTDYIFAWEKALGAEFQAPAYEITLCYASENGPDANSLGYGGNLFYYDKPFDRTWQMVSHEIGTHLLFDSMIGLLGREKYDQTKIYHAYEALAMFFNRRVLGLEALAYDLGREDDAALLETCAREWREGTAPADLFRTIADRFCCR